MYKVNDNFRALAKALYNTNESVNWDLCQGNVQHPCQGIVLPQGAVNHTGGCLECDITKCV